MITVEEESECIDDWKESEVNSESVEEGSPSDLPFGEREECCEEEETDKSVGTSTSGNEEDERIE